MRYRQLTGNITDCQVKKKMAGNHYQIYFTL